MGGPTPPEPKRPAPVPVSAIFPVISAPAAKTGKRKKTELNAVPKRTSFGGNVFTGRSSERTGAGISIT